MSDSLTTYLHDHLAGSKFAIDLLEFLRDQDADEPLASVAKTVLADVQADREILQSIVDRCGDGYPVVKEATSWMAEKVSRWKLSGGSFGTFQALEALSLGILGKLALWDALATIAGTDDRVRDVDFNRLAARARSQHAQMEEQRLKAAPGALENAKR